MFSGPAASSRGSTACRGFAHWLEVSTNITTEGSWYRCLLSDFKWTKHIAGDAFHLGLYLYDYQDNKFIEFHVAEVLQRRLPRIILRGTRNPETDSFRSLTPGSLLYTAYYGSILCPRGYRPALISQCNTNLGRWKRHDLSTRERLFADTSFSPCHSTRIWWEDV